MSSLRLVGDDFTFSVILLFGLNLLLTCLVFALIWLVVLASFWWFDLVVLGFVLAFWMGLWGCGFTGFYALCLVCEFVRFCLVVSFGFGLVICWCCPF